MVNKASEGGGEGGSRPFSMYKKGWKFKMVNWSHGSKDSYRAKIGFQKRGKIFTWCYEKFLQRRLIDDSWYRYKSIGGSGYFKTSSVENGVELLED